MHLNVTDVNDEKPRFVNQPRPFLATVPVNPRVGQLVYELLATDPDTNSDIHYNLESGNDIKMINLIFLNINNIFQNCLEASSPKQFFLKENLFDSTTFVYSSKQIKDNLIINVHN